jgi:ABC-type polysaccharide/polyol phosphate transport system ATPase subunit
MTDVAIRFDRVSKRYRLHYGWYLSLRDELARLARSAFLRDSGETHEFWALSDVSFEIRRGETVGLIGPNGAGKSTILKILSRVTTPTHGSFSMSGNVGALIEVGAGFHPDLTGRENVYLNGAIMGMRKREIDAKFDQIVAFSEVEAFIDQPLKYYSSGMMVRLGFAVAAHIEPEILLVDEVLAVGDTAFQVKCLNKIAELKEQEKTIILVSHTMPSILQNATRVLWIDHGKVKAFGDPEDTVEAYLRAVQVQPTTQSTAEPKEQPASDSGIHISSVTLRDADGHKADRFAFGQPASVDVDYVVTGAVDGPVIGVHFLDVHGHVLGALASSLDGLVLDASEGRGAVRLVLSPVLFTRGTYGVTVAIHDSGLQRYLDIKPRAASFRVEGPSVASRKVYGHVVYPHRWEVRATQPD